MSGASQADDRDDPVFGVVIGGGRRLEYCYRSTGGAAGES